MNDRYILAAVSLAVIALAGCSLVESKGCTDELRIHAIEMTRDLATSDAPDKLLVEACLDTQCRSAKPEANGSISLSTEPFAQGAVDGSVAASAEPAKKLIKVDFSVPERPANATSQLQLRVKSGDATLLDEHATVRWSDDECHADPSATKL